MKKPTKVLMTFEIDNVIVEVPNGGRKPRGRKPLHDLTPAELYRLFAACGAVVRGTWLIPAKPVELVVDGLAITQP